MNLPVYQHINLKSTSLEDLSHILHQDLNLKNPVVINLKDLGMDQQREVIGLIENYYSSQNISFKFPYPIYLLSHHEPSITKVPLFYELQHLPKFFVQRDSKMNVKESHLAGKNRLLQQEVKNSDALANSSDMQNYGDAHRFIYELEQERRYYRTILNRLVKGSKDG